MISLRRQCALLSTQYASVLLKQWASRMPPCSVCTQSKLIRLPNLTAEPQQVLKVFPPFNNTSSAGFHSTETLFKTIPKNAKGKSSSAQSWLYRQLNDPYVKKARKDSFRARSAYKLIEIDERHKLLKPGLGVVECGSAPGAWTQVVVGRCGLAEPGASTPPGRLVAVDLLAMNAITGATILRNTDFTKKETQRAILDHLRPFNLDLVLSDMAPNASGVPGHDHERIMALAYQVARFARDHGAEGGSLLVKVFNGGRITAFRAQLAVLYEHVTAVKPPCSRDNSTELFILAQGLRAGVSTLTHRESQVEDSHVEVTDGNNHKGKDD